MAVDKPSLTLPRFHESWKFLVPSIIYAVNNNLYLGKCTWMTFLKPKLSFLSAGLMLVPPPIWIILCSCRTAVTTLMYKFVMKREVTPLQCLGSLLIVLRNATL